MQIYMLFFKGRICLIHAFSDSHTSNELLWLDFWPVNSFASAKPKSMMIYRQNINAKKDVIHKLFLYNYNLII